MSKVNNDGWIVVVGQPVFTCRTRKQARIFVEKHKVKYPNYNYIGKCFDNYRQIVIDV